MLATVAQVVDTSLTQVTPIASHALLVTTVLLELPLTTHALVVTIAQVAVPVTPSVQPSTTVQVEVPRIPSYALRATIALLDRLATSLAQLVTTALPPSPPTIAVHLENTPLQLQVGAQAVLRADITLAPHSLHALTAQVASTRTLLLKLHAKLALVVTTVHMALALTIHALLASTVLLEVRE